MQIPAQEIAEVLFPHLASDLKQATWTLWPVLFSFFFFNVWNLLILEKEGGGRERQIDLLFHLFIHSLADS